MNQRRGGAQRARSGAVAVAALLASSIVAIGGTPPAARAAAGETSTHSYTGAAGGRQYLLHVPPGDPEPGRPLVVYLHGCNQTAAQAEEATHFSDLADARGFVVAYPQQNVTPGSSAPLVDGNGIGCWNWFLPEHQRRGHGEPSIIAGITEHVVATHQIDATRVYVAGISAGADMAVTMAAAYPDVFAAAGVLAGCAYATCTDATGRLTYEAMGDRARIVPMMVIQGSADTLNTVAQGASLVDSWLGAADWADDGVANSSVPRVPSAVEHHHFDQSPQPGSGDACIRSQNWPCPGGVVGFDGTYPYSVAHYDTGVCRVLDAWVIHGLAHAQPNATGGPFTDPLGPDVTTATYDFFAQHSLDNC